MRGSSLEKLLSRRIVLLDGAMGTMLQLHGLQGNSEEFNLTAPDVIYDIHKEYIEAGADIIESNTFSANRISQKEYGMQDRAYELALEGARIASRAAQDAETTVYVAGSVGPTSKSLTLAPDITRPWERNISFDEMMEAYSQQISGLLDGGVDLILIETCFDALNAKAALYALSRLKRGFPAIVSVSVADRSGRTLTGQTIKAFYTSVRHYPLLAFGMNCSLGPEEMTPLLKDICSWCEVPVICYPNAGLPNEMGQYELKPASMAAGMDKMVRKCSLNIAGGCCGTTPEHICAVGTALCEIRPRKTPKSDGLLSVSGLESVTVDLRNSNFTPIGERTNVAGSRKFAKLIAAGQYDIALEVAANQIEGGASIIDINMDDAMLDAPAEMEKFVRCIQNDPAVAKAALMIDSSSWEAVTRGLKSAQGKCIVNSISLKEGPEEFLRKALEIRSFGAAMVVMAFDENGQATTFERKTEICKRAYDLLTGAGIPPQEIIFDVNVLSVGTGIPEHRRYGIDFIEAVRWIKANLPGAYTSGGISNLSFAFRGNNPVREAMHSVFLFHAIKAGLDMGIVNAGMLQVYDEIEPTLRKCCEDVILDRDPDATERLISLAHEIAEKKNEASGEGSASKDVPAKNLTLEERLSEALVKGKEDTLKEDVLSALEKYGAPVKVIEGPLMAGMERVGALFGDGKMFLPQVVKSAKVMKDAVAVLEPYMKGSQDGKVDRPVIINATVKGDVHDIGKNITGIVLSCNGFEVVDLGVMVEKEKILDEAKKRNAAIIGVSGLITPSLYQMEEICREMTARRMDTPLFIGGATTSALHTAVKLAPLYDHVFYCPDASASAVMAKKCTLDRDAFEKEEHSRQEEIRTLYTQRKSGITPKKVKPTYPAASFLTRKQAARLPEKACWDVPLSEAQSMFDWKMFLAVWGFKYGEDIKDNEQAQKTLKEGKALLRKWVRNGEISVVASIMFKSGYSEDDSMVFEDGQVIPMLRQEVPQKRLDGKMVCASLADFLPQKSQGFTGPMGFFAISVHEKGHDGGKGCDCPSCSSDYDSMMERAVRVTFAEAASHWIDLKLKKMLGRNSKTIVKPAIGYAACPDHTLKKDVLEMLPGADKLGIALTDSYAMIPDASICGLVIIHKDAYYPEIRKISREQYEKYSHKRGFSEDEARRFLGHLL